jgi:hypothetical protein
MAERRIHGEQHRIALALTTPTGIEISRPSERITGWALPAARSTMGP